MTCWQVMGCVVAVAMSQGAMALECSHVKSAVATFTVCRADAKRDELHLYLNDEHGKPLRTFDALEKRLNVSGRQLSFAMNAGMFHASHQPVGVLIEQKKEIAPLNTADSSGNFFMKPNGVFFIDGQGAHVVETARFAAARSKTEITLATQSGPMLVIDGAIHPKLDPNSISRYIRNGVGIDHNGTIVFAASTDVLTLHELAAFFRDTLNCPNALYLDGSVSSIYAPTLNERVQRADLGPIFAIVAPAAGTSASGSR